IGASRCIAFHPTDVNTFWVGADGGIWKTTNGGSSYTPVGDNLPWLRVSRICVDPTNTNTIYACTGNGWDLHRSMGVYKTTDNGVTWKPTGLTSNLIDNVEYSALVMNPVSPQILLVGFLGNGTTQGIYRTADGGATWTKVLAGQRINNMAYKPGDGNIVYAAPASNNGSFYRSTDGGLTWNVVQSFTGGYTDAITCSIVNTAYVAMIHVDPNQSKTLWVSTNSGLNWVKKSDLCSDYTCSNLSFSATTANTIYLGYFEVHKSTDLGATFGSNITAYCCGSPGKVEIHGDFNAIKANPLDKKLYYASDGGLSIFDESVSPYGTASWKERSSGLIISHYIGMGTSQVDPALYGAAGMDNGAWMHKTDGTWHDAGGGDCGTMIFDPKGADVAYRVWGDVIIRGAVSSNFGNEARISDNISNKSGGSSIAFEAIAIDPNNSNVIITGMYTDVFRSADKGNTWANIGANLAGGQSLRGAAIAPSNSNVIYEHCRNKLYVTKNGGTNWSTNILPSNTNPEISSFAVHPTQPGTIWISHDNWSAGNKVFKSTDYGVTWTNESGSLPNLPVTSIVYDKSLDGVYVSMVYGVFYKNSTMSDWINFGQGLPNAQMSNIVVQNSGKKLRCATRGRGMWETDLYSGSATSIDKNINQQALINVYPNPNNGAFTLDISFPDNGNYNLEVANVLGQLIYTESLNINNRNYNFSKQFNLHDLPQGVYMVKINGNGINTNKKISIE
ncbi:MAG: T9SS type A sorting domain-containing protein, partial [Bacteroidetes bacterium]|nr:T9SS type A sorting domain-containing protein [Bacteroidota bacterium]